MANCGESKVDVQNSVKDYYGKVLQKSEDLGTTACIAPAKKPTSYICKALAQVHDEVVKKYFGCGITVPHCLTNMNVVDLGSGSGRDCFALSKLVGPYGNVVGVDMTDEQVDVAKKYVDYHTEKFGYKKPNVKFVKGYIEKLADVGVEGCSVDIAISNCVVCLCEDKRKVLQEVHRVLKNGGEFYFSDVYCDRKLDESVKNHEKLKNVLWNEGLTGSLPWTEFNAIATEVGFETPRVFYSRSFDITKPELREVVGDAKYASVVYRLFKLDPNNRSAAAVAKMVTYKGGIEGCEDAIQLDHQITFKKGEKVELHADTYDVIMQSRMAGFFDVDDAPSGGCPQKATMVNPFETFA